MKEKLYKIEEILEEIIKVIPIIFITFMIIYGIYETGSVKEEEFTEQVKILDGEHSILTGITLLNYLEIRKIRKEKENEEMLQEM